MKDRDPGAGIDESERRSTARGEEMRLRAPASRRCGAMHTWRGVARIRGVGHLHGCRRHRPREEAPARRFVERGRKAPVYPRRDLMKANGRRLGIAFYHRDLQMAARVDRG